MSNTLYRFVKAIETLDRLPIDEEVHLRVYGKHIWTGRFIDEDLEGYVCQIYGQSIPMFQNQFHEIEYLVKVEADQQDLWEIIHHEIFSNPNELFVDIKKRLSEKYTLIPKQ